MIFVATLLVALFIAGPATADPVSGMLIAALGGAASLGTVGVLLVRVGVQLAFSAVAAALFAPRAPKPPGIRTQSTTTGDSTPQSFILGTYATAGNLVAPEMSHGVNGDRRYLTRVIDVGDIPVTGIDYLIIDGKKHTMAGASHASYGTTSDRSDFAGWVWMRFHDGNQTAADPMLLEKYGTGERPWTEEMVGRGVPYLILTFLWRNSPQIWQGRPDIKVVLRGIALYDPRADSSVGGTGAQRWNNPSTWGFSRNPAVMINNILRGIPLPDGQVYGGGWDAQDLPLAVWVAAMNACDEPVTVDGIERPRYVAGYEVRIASPDVGGDEPLDVIDELLKACSGEIADLGGTIHIRVGGPGLPVRFITDEDILRSSPQDLDPFPPLDQTYNGIHATYPAPGQLWNAKEAPPRYDALAEAEDGERLIADVALPTVPDGNQVQRLMEAWLKDARRMRRHNVTLPPEGILLDPLDTLAWSSARNGYIEKVFEIGQSGISTRSLSTTLALRERDPNDYDWSSDFALPTSAPSIEPDVVVPQAVPGWTVVGVAITDELGRQRRPGLRMSWNTNLPGVRAVKWAVRVEATGEVVATGTESDMEAARAIVSDGILPETAYQARGRLDTSAPNAWTDWVSATAPAIYLSDLDLAIDLDAVLADTLAQVEDLEAKVIDAFGPLDVATSLTDRVIAAYGPFEVDIPLVERVSALDADVALQTADIARIDVDMAEQVADIARIDVDIALSIPREIDTTEALASAADQIAWLSLQLSATQTGMADAGFYLDPATGKASIEAVSRIDGQIGEVSISLDAALAQIALRATFSDVNQAVSNALLDPTQIPVIDNFDLRIGTVELTLDAVTGSLTAKADTIQVDGLDVRVTAAELDIDSLEAEIALRVSTEVFDVLGTRVTDAEITLSAIDGAGFGLLLSDTYALAEGSAALAVTTLQQLLDAYEARELQRADIAYVRQDFRALVDEDREAIASVRTELGAAFGNAVALVQSETVARASETAALATDVTALDVRLAGAEGGLSGTVTAVTALTGRVELAETGLVAEGARVDAIDVALSAVETEQEGLASAATALTARVSQTEDGLALEAGERTVLTVQIADAESAASAASIRALLGDWEEAKNRTVALADARTDLQATINEAGEAVALQRLELTAAIDNTTALVTAESMARANGIAALAQDIVSLQAEVGGDNGLLLAAIDQINLVEADSESQNARALHQLQINVSVAEGDISGTATAVSLLDGRVGQTEDGLVLEASERTVLAVQLAEAGSEASAASIRALLGDWDEANKRTVALADARTDLQATVNEAGEAIALQRIELTAAIDNATALVDVERIARATADEAIASDISLVLVQVAANGAAIAQEATVRATADTAQAGLTAGLDARLVLAETGVTGNASATTALDTRVTNAEGALVTQSSAITALESRIDDVEDIEGGVATAITSLDTRVTSAEGTITSQSTSITSLQAGLGTANTTITAQGAALSSLGTRVTSAEGTISSQSSAIVALQDGLTDAQAGVTANSAASTTLDSRVTVAEGTINSYGQSITALNAGLTTANGNISATGTALGSLTTRVTAAEGGITSLTSAGVALEGRVSTAETGLGGVVNAVGVIDTRVTATEGAITTQGSAITGLASSVSALDNTQAVTATAVSGLTTRTTNVEGNVESLTGNLLQLQSNTDTRAFRRAFAFAGTLDGLILQPASAAAGFFTTASAVPTDKRVVSVHIGGDGYAQLRYNLVNKGLRNRVIRISGRVNRTGSVMAQIVILRQNSLTNGDYHSVASSAPVLLPSGYEAFSVQVQMPDDQHPAYAVLLRLDGGSQANITDLIFEDVTEAVQLNASIETLDSTLTTETNAIAARTSLVEASVGAAQADISTVQTATADLQGNASASLVMRARAGQAAGSIEVVAADNPTSAPSSMVRLKADRFVFDGNLAMFANDVSIVGTLNVAGNAITVPARSYNIEKTLITSSNTWITVGQVTLTRAGIHTELAVSITWDGYGDCTLATEIYRGNTPIRTVHAGSSPRGRQLVTSYNTIDFDKGSGATTYYLKVKKNPPEITAGFNADVRVWQVFLSAIQFKR